MWYEILPCLSVMFGAMTLVFCGPTLVTTLAMDKPSGHKRLFHPYEYAYFLRDGTLTGSPYKLQGLEGIPDPGKENPSDSK